MSKLVQLHMYKADLSTGVWAHVWANSWTDCALPPSPRRPQSRPQTDTFSTRHRSTHQPSKALGSALSIWMQSGHQKRNPLLIINWFTSPLSLCNLAKTQPFDEKLNVLTVFQILFSVEVLRKIPLLSKCSFGNIWDLFLTGYK